MFQTMNDIVEQIKLYNNGSPMLILFLICFVYLMICDRNFRDKIGWPLLFQIVILFNPILYEKVWYKITHSIGWRLIWLVDVVFVMIYAVVVFCMKIHKKWLQIGIVMLFLLVMVLCGEYTYSEERFEMASNFYKIPQETIEIVDKLFEIEDNPKAVLPRPHYIYARQYTNRLNLLYGRNIHGYTEKIWDGNIEKVYKELKKKEPDCELITRLCREHETYLIVVRNRKRYAGFSDYQYIPVADVGKYRVYEYQK